MSQIATRIDCEAASLPDGRPDDMEPLPRASLRYLAIKAIDGFKVQAALWQPADKPPAETTIIVQAPQHFLTYRDEAASAADSTYWISRIPPPILVLRDEADGVVLPFEPFMLLSAARAEGSLVPKIKYVLLPNPRPPSREGHIFADNTEALIDSVAAWLTERQVMMPRSPEAFRRNYREPARQRLSSSPPQPTAIAAIVARAQVHHWPDAQVPLPGRLPQAVAGSTATSAGRICGRNRERTAAH